jgi:hypothetical protein
MAAAHGNSWLGRIAELFSRLLGNTAPPRNVATPAPARAPAALSVPGRNAPAISRQPIGAPAKRYAAHEVFTPTKPRAGRAPLIGRQAELARIMEALTQESAHVVIYAERGRGKTSLANLAAERLRRLGVTVGRHACDAASTFDSIMYSLMSDLPESLMSLQADDMMRADGKGCSALLPRGPLQPDDIASIPGRLACNRLVFVMDEFDRVQDQPTRTRLADTMKLLSDRGTKLQFVIVGVSSTLEQIIGQHPSIQRNIAAVHLPLMEDHEIEALLESGGRAAGFVFSADARAVVANIARGMPYMAQLLGLRIIQQCLARGVTETSGEHVAAAIERVLADAPSDLSGRYASLTSGAHGRSMENALRVVAKAPQDKWGRFTAASLGEDAVKRLVEEHVIEPAPHAARGADALPLLQYAERPLIFHALLLDALDHLKTAPAPPVRLVTSTG